MSLSLLLLLLLVCTLLWARHQAGQRDNAPALSCPTRRVEVASVQSDPAQSCAGQHDFLPLHRQARSDSVADLVQWCAHCGAVVIDTEVNGFLHPGAILHMQFPAREFGPSTELRGTRPLHQFKPRGEEEGVQIGWCPVDGAIQIDIVRRDRVEPEGRLPLRFPRRYQP